MITLGYKSPFSSILRACCAIGIGLVMVFSGKTAVGAIKVIAALLFATGVIACLYGLVTSKGDPAKRRLMTAESILDIVLGLILFLFPQAVASVLVYLVGIALVIFGALQLIVFMGASSFVGLGPFSFALSALALIGGIVLLFNPFSLRVMGIIAGLCLIAYGVSELCSRSKVFKAKEMYEIRFTEDHGSSPNGGPVPASGNLDVSGLSDAKEVDYVKEDD